MLQKKMHPDAITLNALLGVCQSSCQWEQALDCLEWMRQYGIVANVRIYSAAINACARAGRLEEAKAVFLHSQKAGVRPNVVLYTSLIHACQVSEPKTKKPAP